MPDYGLLEAFGDALNSGFDSYVKERQNQRNMKKEKMAQSLNALVHGVKENASGSGYEYTPEKMAEIESAREKGRLEFQDLKMKSEKTRGLMDPQSRQSRGAREAYRSAFKQYGINQPGLLSDDMSYDDIKEREDLYKTLISGKQQERLKAIENQNKPPKLPKDKEIFVEKMSGKVADSTAILNMFDQIIPQLDDPKLTEQQKQSLLMEQAKLLNSALGSDALGAEETKRVLAYLDPYPQPFGPKGMKIGPDIKAAIDQYKRARNRQAGVIKSSQDQIASVQGTPKGKMGPTPKPGKVTVTNGKESYEIDQKDLAAAAKDGFRPL